MLRPVAMRRLAALIALSLAGCATIYKSPPLPGQPAPCRTSQAARVVDGMLVGAGLVAVVSGVELGPWLDDVGDPDPDSEACFPCLVARLLILGGVLVSTGPTISLLYTGNCRGYWNSEE
jgi:hypothetical protein